MLNSPPVGTSPAHRALALVRELVALVDRSPVLERMLRSGAMPVAQKLVIRARAVATADPEKKALPPGQAGCFYRWCPDCHAQHEFTIERRQAVRS
jgi:hypothetical protein